MASGTINDIANLKFYSDNGYEIPMQKQYILTWEIIPQGINEKYVKKNPYGYFIGDVDFSDPTNIKIASNSMQACFIENGEVLAQYNVNESTDENGKTIFEYGTNAPDDSRVYTYIKDILLDQSNEVKVSINVNDTNYSATYPIGLIFDFTKTITNYSDYITRNKISIGNNTDSSTSNEYYEIFGIKSIDLVKKNGNIYIQDIIGKKVTNIGLYFPFIRYSGSFTQDTISSGFIASNTIIVIEETDDTSNPYQKPYITSSNKYSLVFQPSSDGELKLISPDSLYEIEYTDERAFYLADPETSTTSITPLSFAIAFQAEIEGAYQNFLGIYMRSADNPDMVFFMGCLVIKTQVEGEDERFRTLLGNFGVVDPIKYSNLFAEQDYQEQGKDFTIINKKSKELMLTYDQIFSYVGTYKALLNAVKFLGYNDIIFKEWYTLKNSNDDETDIAVQIFDTSTGSFLKQKLADFGISIEDFKSYNKINKLSMIYHLNEIDEDNYEYIPQELARYKKATYASDGSVIDPSTILKFGKYTKLTDVPLTKPIYEYRNEETLAKLFGVKKWLETNIIGVNAFISDISGEGIYFGWQKSNIYSTQHYLSDFSQDQYYTPDVKKIQEFKNSNSIIQCTLTELNNGVKFCEYENTPFDAFIRFDSSISMESTNNIQLDVSTISISNTIESPVIGDEFEFELSLQPEYGTLYEWSADSSSQIVYNTGELNLLFDEYSEAEIDPNCLPIITLENANIHKCYGDWKQNIEWSIKEVIDQSTGNTNYKLKNYGTYASDSYAAYDNNYFVLVPSSTTASIKYTENNKYRLPMFVIKGYEFDRNINDIDASQISKYTLGSNNEYIIEILKGDIKFKQMDGVSSILSFSNDNNYIQNDNQNYAARNIEQDIKITYIYNTEKKAFTIINYKEMQNAINSSTFDYSIDTSAIDSDRDSINKYNSNLMNIRSEYIVDKNNNIDNVAFVDASSFIDSSLYTDEVNKFIDKKKEQVEKELLYKDYLSIYEDNYTFNQCIDASVNRLGNYNIICRAYDKYNNIFVNKYPRTADVTSKPISIDLYMAQKNSNNSSVFYRYNIDGSICDSSTISDLIDKCVKIPSFPKNYHINSFDYNPEKNIIEFDNLSYAIDTPKRNDYLILDNFTELCTQAEIDSSLKLYMLDENPHKVYLYNPSTSVKICIYDKLAQSDYINIGPFDVIDGSLQDTMTDNSIQDDSYLILDASADIIDSSIIDIINDSQQYDTYVLNVTEYDVSIYDSNYTDKTSSIIFPNNIDTDGNAYQVFNIEDVVKIRYYINNNISGIDSSIINETTYRIIDIQEKDNQYIYVINGLINEFLCQDPNYRIVMTLASHAGVHYVSRVNDDAIEYNYAIGNGNYVIRDKFSYDSSQMLLNDYIDDTFSGIIYDYDCMNLKKTWFDPHDTFDSSNMDLYYYHEFPVTVPQGQQLIFTHNDIDGIFIPGYHVQWKISNYTFDDTTNWAMHKNIIGKETAYRSINEHLSIKPEMLGSHDIELECIDKYGNRLVNDGGGLLYVYDNPLYINTYQMNSYIDASSNI